MHDNIFMYLNCSRMIHVCICGCMLHFFHAGVQLL